MQSTKQISHLLFVLIASALIAFGQFESGTVLGTIYDPSHAVLSNATVTLANTRTGVTVKPRPTPTAITNS